MRKLSDNQQDLLSCLTNEYMQFKDVCAAYASAQKAKGFGDGWGYAWKSTVYACINTLVKRGLVDYQYRGKYKLHEGYC